MERKLPSLTVQPLGGPNPVMAPAFRLLTSLLRTIIGAVLLLASVGCAPRVVLKAPEEWPAEWSGRKLYNTPRAYVYAGGDLAAGEADRLVEAVAAEFRRDTGEAAAKGLVIVNDRVGESPVASWRELLKLAQQQQAADTTAAQTQPTSRPDEDIEKKVEGTEKAMAEMGVSLDLVVSMSAIGLSKDDLACLTNLPQPVTAAADWSVIIPTRSLLTDANRRMMRAMFKKQKIGIVQQALMAPLMVLVEPIMIDMMSAMRAMPVYQAITYAHTSWPEERRREVYRRYRDRKTRKITADMQSGMEKARKQAPRPATHPATATSRSAASRKTKE